MVKYETIPHTADVGIRVRGKDQRELFSSAAEGMFDIIADIAGLEPDVCIDVDIRAGSPEELMVAWLDELLYAFYTKNLIFSKFDIIDIGQDRLKARASGRHIGDNRNRLKKEIKAVTFHNLDVKESPDGFSAEIIFDV